ncbi:MAG: hypothetical protein U5M50_04105 [Sphingobium sp.]|nr:hypothetical protein [Sphingobium sp.]
MSAAPIFTPEQSDLYRRLAHAMQTGVAHDQAHGSQDGTAKHLRVGVNCAMVEHSALARLLIDKGVITASEYADALIAGMEAEVRSYEARVEKHFGVKVNLL